MDERTLSKDAFQTKLHKTVNRNEYQQLYADLNVRLPQDLY